MVNRSEDTHACTEHNGQAPAELTGALPVGQPTPLPSGLPLRPGCPFPIGDAASTHQGQGVSLATERDPDAGEIPARKRGSEV